jgi:HK97 gp10 family phage protein
MANDQYVRIAGLSELQKMLDILPARMEANLMRGGMRQGANFFRDRARANVPEKSGDLKKSIKVKTSVRKGKVITQVVAGGGEVFYAKFIEFGTASFYAGNGKTVGAPYKIEPKNAKALKFGNTLAPYVIHQGIKPVPFMRRAFDGAEFKVIEITAEYIRDRLDTLILK